MNRHQILTGAVNAGDNCFSVGSVEGIAFTAYSAGCNVVILASDFSRVQIIPGILHGNVQVSCLDASTDVGKIAVAYGKKICIFEPTPVLTSKSSHRLDYKWIQTASLENDCSVSVLSWNIEGTKLLSGGTAIQTWHLVCFPDETIAEENETDEDNIEGNSIQMHWDCVWRCKTATPVFFLRFSPDGQLFISAGKADRLVKIWYESAAKISYTGHIGVSEYDNHLHNSEVGYSFIYIAHPRAITGISWRKTSKYVPRGCTANMLVTSCRDNTCRLWVQTLLPDDGLVNFSQIEGLDKDAVPRSQTRRHREKILHRMRHMKSFNFKKRQDIKTDVVNEQPIPSLPSTFSVHDFHNFGVHATSVTPGFHFHLAASINAETDIPLVPSLSAGVPEKNEKPKFIMQWLNNKEMVLTQAAEKLLSDMSAKIFQDEAPVDNQSEAESDPGDEAAEDGASTVTADSGKRSQKSRPLKKPENEDVEELKSKQSMHTTSSSGSLNVASEVGSGNSNARSNSHETAQNAASTLDVLDRKFETLLRDWHSAADLLVSVHPADGSLLVWLIEYLDETSPGSFRQAKVSFSSRIPDAIPVGDAGTISHNLFLYSPTTYFDIQHLKTPSSVMSNLSKASDLESTKQTPVKPVTPVVYMITKHTNGSLNQWTLTFESFLFTQIVSVDHESRVSGHRFRVNDISCHPVLPLLLTTSHHNLPGNNLKPKSPGSSFSTSPSGTPSKSSSDSVVHGPENIGFCSELILWKVDPVSQSSKAGGVTELARINSLELSAFANVGWIPTLLPSATLGPVANSPSACFIASDGHQLRIYQAIIDARTLLAEIAIAQRREEMNKHDFSRSASEDGHSSDYEAFKHSNLHENFKVVSLQSTARPGCILELSGIKDAVHDWQNTQLLHVFQDQLIRGEKATVKLSPDHHEIDNPGLVEPSLGAVVDLRNSADFEEPFHLVVLEKNKEGQSIIHMWKLIISSQAYEEMNSGEFTYAPDSKLIPESDHSNRSSRSASPEISAKKDDHDPASSASPLKITTSKVCSQVLNLPADVEVIHAAPAAGHLSSSNIYPACFAPYLISTACSDGTVRFWRCNVEEGDETEASYEWLEWDTMLDDESVIEVPGLPLHVSCAYSGRVACAYKQGQSFTKPTSGNPDTRFININVAIYECESTGGSEWVLEDTIKLKNVVLPQTESNMGIDIGPLIDTSKRNRKAADALMMRLTPDDPFENRTTNLKRLISVPSYTTMQSLKKIISEQGNQFTLTQKSLVQMDWVSTEDGSHVLTVTVGSNVLIFTPVSTDIAQSNVQAMKTSAKTGSTNPNRMLLKQASSMGLVTQPDDLRWMCLRHTVLKTADGLPPLPMQMSWVRDGILVVGMDNEMHIYTQWKSEDNRNTQLSEITDGRLLTDKGLLSHAQETAHLRLPATLSANRSPSISNLSVSNSSVTKPAKPDEPEDAEIALRRLPDFGIFEACRLACPVLPQYHPKQLMELLAFGKIPRVRAILSHLVIVLCSIDSLKDCVEPQAFRGSESETSPRPFERSRTLSGAVPTSPGPLSPIDAELAGFGVSEEPGLDYTEITSIKPLPLFTLVEAEFENQAKPLERTASKGRESAIDSDYGGLFDQGNKSQVEETLDEILNRSAFNFNANKQAQQETMDMSTYGPRQARILTKLLTHSHLPGLSSLDQMHLLALADAVASFNPSKGHVVHTADSLGVESSPEDVQAVAADALDDCGLRFLLTMRQHTYLLKCLPMAQRRQLHKDGLNTCNLVWAFHSETEEELVQLITSQQRRGLKWSTLRELGVGWWLRNNAVLKRLVEQLAKSAFQQNNDPLDAALFYLAMKKKSLVWGLFRSISDKKMTDFFQHNFAEDKWRKAALKNAYALLGKQRFEHAAAFFLLAGNVWDAVQICLTKLEDIQLAMVVVRLYDGDIETVPENLKRLLYLEVLGCSSDGMNQQNSKAHPDPFLRSMAYWTLQEYSLSLTTLLDKDVGYDHSARDSKKDKSWVSPNVFNFYLFLRTHPLIIRRHCAQTVQEKKDAKNEALTSDSITPYERRLFFLTANQHFRAGCPSLALEVLSRLPNRLLLDDGPLLSRQESIPVPHDDVITGTFNSSALQPVSEDMDWGAPVAPKKELSLDLDWGAPSAGYGVETEFKIEFDANDELDDDDEDDIGLELKASVSEVPNLELSEDTEVKLDIMAQQLKFIACLKIIMEELSTLSTGMEVDEAQLRHQLYLWLEKTVNSLKTICSYRTLSMKGNKFRNVGLPTTPSLLTDDNELADRNSHPETNGANEIKHTLHETLIADRLEFEAKIDRTNKRKQWLKANEALLRTLISYCSLHGSHGGGLALVRIELIMLLQELQQERPPHHLPSPLPPPTTLPSLDTAVSSQKAVTDDAAVPQFHNIGTAILQSRNEMPLQIVYKDTDVISTFCVNKSNRNMLALATLKDIHELDIKALLEPVRWSDEDANYDIDRLTSATEEPTQAAVASTAKVKNFLKRQRTEGTKRMSSHPNLPLYVSGSQDGSVSLWEWNHHQVISKPRPPGTFAKVTRTAFNQQGNKFGITDADGNLNLWQVAMASAGSKPYFNIQVHSKIACDFTFLNACSLVVTAGQSTDHKNVCLWDTLLPDKKSLVKSFACHEQHGASAIVYAPLNQLLITGGKKGDVYIFDMRQRSQRHKFQAHESAVKCLALDPGEEFFATGSADGNIKVWSLGVTHGLLYTFPGEHSRSTLFRNLGMGVSHLYIDSAGRLYSCGADGTMKLRQLPDRNANSIIATL
ncbi:DmX-like protein 2 [Halotydeus destructor]|nr:DmX-like protein 2 [Halotydeus destructor]